MICTLPALSLALLSGCDSGGEDLLDKKINFIEDSFNEKELSEDEIDANALDTFDSEVNAKKALKNFKRLAYGLANELSNKGVDIDINSLSVTLEHVDTSSKDDSVKYAIILLAEAEDAQGEVHEFSERIGYSSSYKKDKGWVLN
jgi:hypothetical protein